MLDIKKILDDLLFEIKKDNPNANFRSLLTGIVILFMVGTFSIWYFSNSNKAKVQSSLLGTSTNYQDSLTGYNDSLFTKNDKVEPDTIEYTLVAKGEGLWHVAKRVCGDGEAYKYLAQANGLNIHRARLSIGQELKVVCERQ